MVLRTTLTEIAKKAFIRVDETVGEASPGQAMWIGAVAVDKIDKLDSREMSIPDEPFTKEKWDSMNKTRDMFVDELIRRREKERAIDIAPKNDGSPGTPQDT